MTPQDTTLMTRMLFTDAVVGVGFPHPQVGVDAERGGLATVKHDAGGEPVYAWNRRILETLSTETLQDLYTSLKLHEVTHAS